MQLYLMIQLGSNFFSAIEMPIFRWNEVRYYENVLHHSIASVLILLCVMCNMGPSGIVTLILHDLSNTTLAICRVYYDTNLPRFKIIQFALGLSLLICWFFTRVFMLPGCVLKNLFDSLPKAHEPWHMIYWPHMSLLGIGITLYIMHIYWSYYIVKSLAKSIRKGYLTHDHPDLKE